MSPNVNSNGNETNATSTTTVAVEPQSPRPQLRTSIRAGKFCIKKNDGTYKCF
jgi:hypothetical protein